MTPKMMLAARLSMIGAIGVATWILATFTLGATLSSDHSVAIGFAVSVLVVVTACFFLLFGEAVKKADPHVGKKLFLGGAACVLVSAALQGFLALVVSHDVARLMGTLDESIRSGADSANVHLSYNLPSSVSAVGYLLLFFGIGMLAIGVRMWGQQTNVAAPDRQLASHPDLIPKQATVPETP